MYDAMCLPSRRNRSPGDTRERNGEEREKETLRNGREIDIKKE